MFLSRILARKFNGMYNLQQSSFIESLKKYDKKTASQEDSNLLNRLEDKLMSRQLSENEISKMISKNYFKD